jgi:hypothetical protein
VRLSALAALLLLAGCGHPPARPEVRRFSESGVEVTLRISAAMVQATYRPVHAGFHVYSIALPPGGVGTPTRLDVRGGLAATGPARADKVPRPLVLAGMRLPVYPDGPVRVSLPVRRTGRTAEVLVSYGACGATTCLAPVVGHRTSVTLR